MRRLAPGAAIPMAELFFGQTPGTPAGLRRQEQPAFTLPDGEPTGLSGPGAGWAGPKRPGIARRGVGRRGLGVKCGDAELYQRIQHLQRLVMGHVFLRLRRHQIGQGQDRGGLI